MPKLPATAQQNFEEKLKNDTEIQNEVALQKDIIEGINRIGVKQSIVKKINKVNWTSLGEYLKQELDKLVFEHNVN